MDATKKVLDHNGYHTGDLGYIDKDGFLYITDRMDNILKIDGRKINPKEIEDVFMETGQFIEVAVFGIPDKLLGNKLIALVSLKNNALNKNIVLKKCAQLLPRYKMPGYIIFKQFLPKSSQGKIDKIKCLEIINKELRSRLQ